MRVRSFQFCILGTICITRDTIVHSSLYVFFYMPQLCRCPSPLDVVKFSDSHELFVSKFCFVFRNVNYDLPPVSVLVVRQGEKLYADHLMSCSGKLLCGNVGNVS